MKKTIKIFALVSGSLMQGQVGVGTSEPKATLHIKEPTNLTGTQTGFIPPRMSTTDRDKMTLTSEQNGLMIYNLDRNCFQGYEDGRWEGVNCFVGDVIEVDNFDVLDTSSSNFFGQGDLNLTSQLKLNSNFNDFDNLIDDTSFRFKSPVESWYSLVVQPTYFDINNGVGITVTKGQLNVLRKNSFFALLDHTKPSGSSSWIGGSRLDLRWEYDITTTDSVILYGFYVGGSATFENYEANKEWTFGLHGVQDYLEGVSNVRLSNSAQIVIQQIKK